MITLTFQQAAAQMPAELLFDTGRSFCGVSTDSRSVKPGMLYVPIVGERADGHDFARAAIEAGASGLFWQKDHPNPPKDVPVLLVGDPVKALGDLARVWLEQLDCLIIGVTGSNGKTSTKDLLASIFKQQYKTHKTQGNHNNEIGLPLTVFETDADTEVLILEMGMENLGEIAYLCSIAPLDGAMITSIGSAHLVNLGSMDNIARAKLEILSSLKPEGVFVFHADSKPLARVMEETVMDESWKQIPYGAGTDYAPVDLHFSREGLRFSLTALSPKPFSVKAAASVQADNATGAILMAHAFGVGIETCRKGVAQAVLTPMRGQIIPYGQALLLDDTYKSNPEAALEALETLMQIPAACHIAVLGDMLDLGDEEIALHEQIGEKAKALGIDVLYAYGPLSAHTCAAFGQGAKHFETKEEIESALAPVQAMDAAILVKGSRAMQMDSIVKACLERISHE